LKSKKRAWELGEKERSNNSGISFYNGYLFKVTITTSSSKSTSNINLRICFGADFFFLWFGVKLPQFQFDIKKLKEDQWLTITK